MNKQFKEIAKRAGMMYLHDYSSDGDAMVCNASDIEQFANLIIQECLSIVEPRSDSGDEWDAALRSSAEEIREHFELAK